jgi:carboxymethylenebutenolidase
MGQTISLPMNGGECEGYLALPPGGRGPGLLVLPEIYNSNAWVRAVTDRFAAQGYLAVAPDIYWRQGPRQYSPYTPEGVAHGRSLGKVLEENIDVAIDDTGAWIDLLRQRPECTGKVGVIGYCLGGKLAFLAGTRKKPDAVVMYYPVRLPPYLHETMKLTAPAMMHFGDRDEHIPSDMVDAIRHAVAGMGNIAIHEYTNASHGFARFGQPTCSPEAESLAASRTLAFLTCLA